MRTCPKCGLPGSALDFYPESSAQKWCKSCVERTIRHRHREEYTQLRRKEQEQKAIRLLASQLQTESQPFVYLLKGPGGYKIGFSSRVSKRVAQLNTALASTCELIAMAPGGRELEKQLHHLHRFKRLNREWFRIGPQIFKDFTQLPGVFVFLPGYMTSEVPANAPALVEKLE